MKKPTFKKSVHTGQWKIFQTDYTYIKVSGKICGNVRETKFGGNYEVGFMTTAKSTENCSWGWVFIKEKFESEEKARAWVVEHIEDVNKEYPLRFEE